MDVEALEAAGPRQADLITPAVNSDPPSQFPHFFTLKSRHKTKPCETRSSENGQILCLPSYCNPKRIANLHIPLPKTLIQKPLALGPSPQSSLSHLSLNLKPRSSTTTAALDPGGCGKFLAANSQNSLPKSPNRLCFSLRAAATSSCMSFARGWMRGCVGSSSMHGRGRGPHGRTLLLEHCA